MEVKKVMSTEQFYSHSNVLKKVISALPRTSRALEFGCGTGENCSTKLLSDNFLFLTSIEMNSKEWYEKIKSSFELDNLIYCPGAFEWKKLELLSDFYSLIFVDGHEDSRWDCVNWAFDRTDIIVVHDTEEKLYQWNKIIMPIGWSRIDVVSERPWSTVFTKVKDVEKVLIESDFTIVLNGKYFNKFIKKIPGSVAWVTRCGPEAFTVYKNEFATHLTMLEKGMNSYWFCNFPLSEEHKKAELAPIEQHHNLDISKWVPYDCIYG
jgi:hypothetical protein